MKAVSLNILLLFGFCHLAVSQTIPDGFPKPPPPSAPIGEVIRVSTAEVTEDIRWLPRKGSPELRAWQTSGQTAVGIQETRFALNGQPTFLLGISYYGALGLRRSLFGATWMTRNDTASTG